MRTQGAKPAQLAAMVIFAFSCFGLLLFLWLSFGGPIPLKPKGYQVQMAFPEATTLAEQAEVRVAGVPIGKVRKLAPDPGGNRTLATIEIERPYAPLKKDARAMLRQKTLLGETYVELTTGSKNAPDIPEGGRLQNTRVEDTIELDEVLEVFPPETRDDFRRWMANSHEAIEGRGADLNNALGSIAGFATDGEALFETLDRRREALRSLVSETGNVFEALTRDEESLRALIQDTAVWFRAAATEREALAESIQILPTFLRESRATLARVEDFSRDTKPLVDDLGPVARDLRPALADLREASPDMRRAFTALPALIRRSRTGLPALSRILRGLEPALDATGPFLRQLNAVLEWLEFNQVIASNFLSAPNWALQGRASTQVEGANGHILPQQIVTGSQTMISPVRSPDNRGNAYLRPDSLVPTGYGKGFNTLPSWDCKNTNGEHQAQPRNPGCWVQQPFNFQGKVERFPRVLESDFSRATR